MIDLASQSAAGNQPLICRLMLFLSLFQFGMGTACSDSGGQEDPSYVDEIRQWREARYQRLVTPDGWLSLSGLFWLQDGINTFGGAEKNDIIFPGKDLPATIGRLILENGKVVAEIAENVEVRCDSAIVSRTIVFGDNTGEPKILTFGTLSWFVVQRAGAFLLRLSDSANPNIAGMKPIDYYQIDSHWRVSARLVPHAETNTIEVEDVLGLVREFDTPGKLVFELGGKTFELDALDSGEDLFIIFADETSAEQTYGAGRYLYTKKPVDGDMTVIDFNKAYNPPCAYTDFATCPLPPMQNRLAVAITAGERFDNEGHYERGIRGKIR